MYGFGLRVIYKDGEWDESYKCLYNVYLVCLLVISVRFKI